MSNLDEILLERGKEYGPFSTHADISQKIKSAIFEELERPILNSQREALEMIAHKIARIINGNRNHIDSWKDIAGYATLIVKELEEN